MRWREKSYFGLEVGGHHGDPALAGEQRQIVLRRGQGHARDAAEEAILCIRWEEWRKRGCLGRGHCSASHSTWIGPSMSR